MLLVCDRGPTGFTSTPAMLQRSKFLLFEVIFNIARVCGLRCKYLNVFMPYARAMIFVFVASTTINSTDNGLVEVNLAVGPRSLHQRQRFSHWNSPSEGVRSLRIHTAGSRSLRPRIIFSGKHTGIEWFFYLELKSFAQLYLYHMTEIMPRFWQIMAEAMYTWIPLHWSIFCKSWGVLILIMW